MCSMSRETTRRRYTQEVRVHAVKLCCQAKGGLSPVYMLSSCKSDGSFVLRTRKYFGGAVQRLKPLATVDGPAGPG